MRGAIPPVTQYAFMAWCSVKAQGLYVVLNVGSTLPLLCQIRIDYVSTFYVEVMKVLFPDCHLIWKTALVMNILSTCFLAEIP
jgi:hypothetical protein